MPVHSIEGILVFVDEPISIKIGVGQRESDGFIFIWCRSSIGIRALVKWDSNRQLVDFICPAEILNVGRVD